MDHYKRLFDKESNVQERNAKAEAAYNEAEVFFWKMKGDYHRYVAEYMKPNERTDPGEKAIEAYKRASTAAEKSVRECTLLLSFVRNAFVVLVLSLETQPHSTQLLLHVAPPTLLHAS